MEKTNVITELAPGNTCMEKINGITERTLLFSLRVGGVLLAAALVVGAGEVFFRYVLRAAHDWGGEVMRDLALSGIFLAGAQVLWRKRHINVSLLLDKLSPPNARRAEIVNAFFAFVVLGLFSMASVYRIAQLQSAGMRVSNTLRYELWLPVVPIVVGLFLMMVVAALMLLNAIRSKPGGRE